MQAAVACSSVPPVTVCFQRFERCMNERFIGGGQILSYASLGEQRESHEWGSCLWGAGLLMEEPVEADVRVFCSWSQE